MRGPFLVVVLLAAAGAGAWWWPSNPAHAISVALAVLIVTCPCALSLATPAATLAAAGALARRGVLVRTLQALEVAAGVDTVVFDKTGTLTGERMRVVSGTQRPGVGFDEALVLAAALARHSLHPASLAILERAPAQPLAATGVTLLPGQGLSAEVVPIGGGAARRLWLGSASLCRAATAAGMQSASQVHLADAQGWLASFVLDEALRGDSAPAVQALRAMGIAMALRSGDNAGAVAGVARSAGIDDAQGACSPQDKLAHVATLQGAGAHVAMVGDGMNDAAVLARADVSVAMGQAVAAARSKADFVLMGSAIAAVPMLLKQARRTRTVIRQNLAWAALYNLVCVPLAVMGQMPPWLAGLGMAASSLFVVLNSARLARLPPEL